MSTHDGRPDPFTNMFEASAKSARAMMMPFSLDASVPAVEIADWEQWADVGMRLQRLWLEFQTEHPLQPNRAAMWSDPAKWMTMAQGWYRQMPISLAEQQQALWSESLQVWEQVLGQFGLGLEGQAKADGEKEFPRSDKRFADERWRSHPAFALIHQTYLLIAERLSEMVDQIGDLPPDKQEQLRFFTKAITDAASPANFALLNPVVLERTLETKGENLVKGMEHLLADMRRGQLSHTDAGAFEVGRNIATTPGKVVHETDLFQLIQYSPTTDEVLETPLVIFPPWINRFYILDLNEKKSFVRWAVAQGITVFMVSWRSADASMADIVWDDYVRSQIEAIDHIRDRLQVEAVHAIGYCVAGTTLAATLALLTERGEAEKVRSATFFTAQVDFEEAGDLLHFVDDQQLAAVKAMSPDGYLDGRYMAATFNLLRGTDLIWNYVINNYLLGEDYPAFDLLHWNGDVTNLPAQWHQSYLRDLYRDNRLAKPGGMTVEGTPIDLRTIEVPVYIQAGREDHIAPAKSVWRLTKHLSGPIRFVLAGSGHIAGVVNPPDAKKYQYWINEGKVHSLDDFVETATEHKGSWWPDWVNWLQEQNAATVKATGKRTPGSKNDAVIEDAPGRYVQTR